MPSLSELAPIARQLAAAATALAEWLEQDAPAAPASTAPATDEHGGFIAAARAYLGQPYEWGGLDCSGLIYLACRALGYQTPRLTAGGYAARWPAVDLNAVHNGDVLYFSWDGGGPDAEHIGIRVAPGRMLHAPQPGDVVKESDLSDWWRARLVSAHCPFGLEGH